MNRSLLVSLLVVVLGAGVTIAVVDNGSDHEPGKPRRSFQIHFGPTTKVDNADPDAKPDNVVQLSPAARDVAQDVAKAPGDLKPDKPDAPPLEGSAPQVGEGVIPAPLAADEITGCRTRFLTTNFSQRSVPPSKVVLFELHYTAGPDMAGSRADVDGLTAFGNRPSSRVSWHFNMDKDGNCDYNVPLRLKAWTIANLNSYTVNIEVAGKGEAPYLRPAGYRKLASIIAQVREAYPGILLSLGQTDGHCHPTKGGIDSHYRGGLCSGGHTDIKPRDLLAVISRIRAATPPSSSKADRWRERHAALHKLGRPLTREERAKNRRYHELLRLG